MKKHLLTLALIAALFIAGFELKAQEEESDPIHPKVVKKPVFPGIVFGYNQTMHSVDLSSIPEIFTKVPCPHFSNGNASGYFAGICYEHFFGDFAQSNSSIVGRLMYNTFPSNFEVAGVAYPSVFFPNGDTIPVSQTSNVDHKMTVTYATVTLDLLYKLTFYKASFGAFGLYVGPTFDYALTKTWEQEMDLISPANAQFVPAAGVQLTNNGRTEVFASGDITGAASLRVGMKIGLLYEILLKNGIILVPNVCYDYGITKLTTTDNWRVNALQFGIDIRYGVKLF